MPRRNTTRRSYLKWVGAGGATGLAGCASGGGGGDGADTTTESGGGDTAASTTGGTTTTVSGRGGTVHFLNDRSARDVWENAAEEFSSQSDYEVDITWLPKGTTSNEQVAKMRAAGNLPALIFESSTDCYRETKEGITTPLTGVVEELGVKDVVPVDGDSYMVPAVAIPLIMTYRTDVVQGDPRTRSEWMAEAQRIKDDEGMSGYVVPSGRTNAATTHANQTLWNGGVDPYAGSGEGIEVLLDQGENREKAVKSYEWLQEMDGYGPKASGWGWGDLMGALIQEQLVAWAGLGGLAILELQANRPEIASNFVPAPYPRVEGTTPTQWWSYFEGMYSYADAENTEGAKEFLKFFMTSDYYFEFLRQTALFNFPTSRSGLDDERYSEAEVIQQFPGFLDLVKENWDDMAPVLQTGDDRSPNIIAANAYGQQLYGQSIDRMLYGDDSAGEAVDWLAEQLRTEMS